MCPLARQLNADGYDLADGNHTFRAWMREDAGDDALRDVVTQVGALGCLIEGYSPRLIGLSCSPENIQDVAQALDVAAQEGRFTYETGRQRRS